MYGCYLAPCVDPKSEPQFYAKLPYYVQKNMEKLSKDGIFAHFCIFNDPKSGENCQFFGASGPFCEKQFSKNFGMERCVFYFAPCVGGSGRGGGGVYLGGGVTK